MIIIHTITSKFKYINILFDRMPDDLVFLTLSVTLCDNEYDLNNLYKFIISQYLYYFNFYINKNRVKIIKYTSNLFMYTYTKQHT